MSFALQSAPADNNSMSACLCLMTSPIPTRVHFHLPFKQPTTTWALDA